jgi:hypothetical protein
MVLEHQAGLLNRLARANLETRMALHYQRELNQALGQPADEPSESARSRIKSVGDAVVEYMLFRDEARLTDRIAGTSSFAADFAARGPRDSKGPIAPRPRPQHPAVPLSVQLPDLFRRLRRHSGAGQELRLPSPAADSHRSGSER